MVSAVAGPGGRGGVRGRVGFDVVWGDVYLGPRRDVGGGQGVCVGGVGPGDGERAFARVDRDAVEIPRGRRACGRGTRGVGADVVAGSVDVVGAGIGRAGGLLGGSAVDAAGGVCGDEWRWVVDVGAGAEAGAGWEMCEVRV
jgi:hypothetical protein